MSETKFTKGEWAVLPIEGGKEYIRVRGTRLGCKYKIANVVDQTSHHDGSFWCKMERQESIANAHLIAEAPEMYAMLETLLEYGIPNTHYEEEVENLLSKARGES